MPRMATVRSSHPGAVSRRLVEPLTLDDLTRDLVWVRLLRAGPLSLRPARLGLGLAYLVCVGIVLAVTRALIGPDRAAAVGLIVEEHAANLGSAVLALGSLAPKAAAREVYALGVELPARLLSEATLATLLAGPALVWLTAVVGGAISRSVATEAAQGVSLAWPKALGFALGRWTSLTGALAIPLILVWGVALGLHVAGWALLSLPVVNIVGGLAWGLLLVGGLVGAVVLLAMIVGHPLLLPSVAVEGTDAVDAVQHAYSFVFARPLRLAAYWALLIVQGAALLLLAGLVVHLALQFVAVGASGWSGEAGRRIVGALPAAAIGPDQALATSPRGTERVAAGIASLFTVALLGVLGAVVVSYAFTGSTLLYLAMRRVVDGQDMSEVYMPTLIPGTQSPTPAAAGVSAPRTSPAPAGREGVSDTGPADET
jgi:hypothetical protein